MIIARAPLRISLGGGGTDLQSFYSEHTGQLIAAAIDKYVYINANKRFIDKILLKYSAMEEVENIADIKHAIIREALLLTGIKSKNIEITSMADIPAGTGLGSSGSFTVALLNALNALQKNIIPQHVLAEKACEIEIDRLKEPIGKQDQYIAAIGGITEFIFLPNGKVQYTKVNISEDTLIDMEDNLVLFFTGYSRAAATILQDQKTKTEHADPAMIASLQAAKEIGKLSKTALEQGNLEQFAKLMDTHWRQKQTRTKGMSNQDINDCYNYALANGALGGKLIGAGGGGFLMFYAADRKKLRHAMRTKNLEEVRFRFDFEGTKLLTNEF